MGLHASHADRFAGAKTRRAAVCAKWLVLAGLWMSCIPCPTHAQGSGWYLNPYAGGITPDKPWGGKGAAALFGIDIGVLLSPVWSTELDLNDAPLGNRFGGRSIDLYSAAPELRRTFQLFPRFSPYVSLGAGGIHLAPPEGTGLQNRTEFMVQPGAGALIGLWESGDRSRSIALRPDIKLRWTHGWAHAPGNPVDPLYVLGLTTSF